MSINSGSDIDEEMHEEIEGFSRTEVGPPDIIYIAFSFYKKDFEDVVGKYRCKIRFSVTSYIVYQFGECTNDEFV